MAQLMAFRSQMSIINLRYFNVAGSSHKEFIDKSPFNILPKLFKCVSNEEDFEIRGGDYETRDGTCIRDYIHIEDVVEATTRAGILSLESRCAFALNVGSGIGTSVKELVDQAQLITGKKIRTKYTDRRPGDPDIVIADNRKIKKVLNWSPKMSLRDMVASSLVSNF
jgi:UDP-glucose 4-epimerase